MNLFIDVRLFRAMELVYLTILRKLFLTSSYRLPYATRDDMECSRQIIMKRQDGSSAGCSTSLFLFGRSWRAACARMHSWISNPAYGMGNRTPTKHIYILVYAYVQHCDLLDAQIYARPIVDAPRDERMEAPKCDLISGAQLSLPLSYESKKES